jgi:hypothetical protein
LEGAVPIQCLALYSSWHPLSDGLTCDPIGPVQSLVAVSEAGFGHAAAL